MLGLEFVYDDSLLTKQCFIPAWSRPKFN